MQKPPIPENEAARLAELRDYDILDTATEKSFDDIVALASMICQVPIALVSLVDEHRQWFKARHGVELAETPRDISFCGHAILGADVMEVPDSRQDERFMDNPFVEGDQGVRFYAGAPLVTARGYHLGTLCVIDHQPRQLTPEQTSALQALARQVIHLFELRRLASDLKQKISKLEESEKNLSLERAKALQAAKLASLGEMSAGIAHEINSPLAVISGVLQALPKYLSEPERLRSKAELGMKAVERISTIVTGLRKFSRSSAQQPHQLVPLGRVVQEAIVLVGAKAHLLRVPIHWEVPPDAVIRCNEIEMEQVMVNLLRNSLYAVRHQDERWVRVQAEVRGERVVLRIRDAGRGLLPEVRSRLFQPFFTTKPPGEGTGLGLSIIKGILEDHGAMIRLVEDDGHTCFEISFALPQEVRHAV